MGVQLTSLVEGQVITFEELFDKKVAVDALNWIYQFLSIIRQMDGEPLKDSKGNITSHLSGLFYRNMKLLEAKIKPIYVFDGPPPAFKKETNEKRRDIRAEAAREWKEALERKDYESAKKFAKRSVTITDEIIEESKKLLNAMGIPCIKARSEGEALCGIMVKNGDAHAAATQDYDPLLYGCPRLVRNLSITGKRKRGNSFVIINPEMMNFQQVLSKLGITHEQLVMLGILVGTDYNPGGVAGYGPKKALDLVREKKTFEDVFSDLIWEHEVSARDIYDFFLNPIETDYSIKFGQFDEEKVKHILCDEHDFSEERINSAHKKIKQKGDQSSLNRWFG